MQRRLQARSAQDTQQGYVLHERPRELQGPAGQEKLQPSEADLLKYFLSSPGHQLEILQISDLMGQGEEAFNRRSLEVPVMGDSSKDLFVSWDEYHRLIEELARRVHASGMTF
ncbi:MAG: hypothetical protein VW257_02285 [Quisquiliibacterium sp.]